MFEITLSAPGKNALGTDLMVRVLAQLRAAAGAPILVTGAGDAFSAGLNLKELASLDEAGVLSFLSTLEEVIDALYNYPAPTVAWVNGHAIAGGCLVALSCDHRVASEDPRIRIGLNEVALGLQFPPKAMAMVRRQVPSRGLERVLLEAALHGPEVARGLGLVDEVAHDAGAVARAHLARLAAHPREAYSATKRTLRGHALTVRDEDTRHFREVLVPLWCSPELKRRVSAALKR